MVAGGDGRRILVVGGFGTEVLDAVAQHGAASVLLQTSGTTTGGQRAAAEEVVEVPDLADRDAEKNQKNNYFYEIINDKNK